MTPQERIARAQRAEQALEFAAPAFDHLVANYREKQDLIACSTPWEADKITALSQAIRVVQVAREQIELLITDGIEAHAEVDFARKYVEMSASDRRLLNIAARR